MARLRFRDGNQRKNGSLLLLALGAVAGMALGMALAERTGGLSGLSARVRRTLGRDRLADDDEMLESMRLADAAAGADDDFEDDDFDDDDEDDFDDDVEDELGEEFDHDHGDGMSAVDHAVHGARPTPSGSRSTGTSAPSETELEARVLEVFRNDPVLRGQAIDIGAIGNGTIELTGWVKSAAEVRYASTLAGGVLGVHDVMDSLSVRGSESPRVGAARTDR